MKKRKKKTDSPGENLPTLPFFGKTESGKIEDVSSIVYSFSLPCLSSENFRECKKLLESVKEAFLLFLKKESKKKREGIYLGTLSFQSEKNRVTLLSSFSPFEEKMERAVATLIFSEDGSLLAIKK